MDLKKQSQDNRKRTCRGYQGRNSGYAVDEPRREVVGGRVVHRVAEPFEFVDFMDRI